MFRFHIIPVLIIRYEVKGSENIITKSLFIPLQLKVNSTLSSAIYVDYMNWPCLEVIFFLIEVNCVQYNNCQE